MAQLPIDVKLARVLVDSVGTYFLDCLKKSKESINNTTSDLIILIAMLSVEGIFYSPQAHKDKANEKRKQFFSKFGIMYVYIT